MGSTWITGRQQVAGHGQCRRSRLFRPAIDRTADVEIKLGGADASSPSSTGVVVNVVTPRGGNQFKGSAAYTYQPLGWNGDNAHADLTGVGVPTLQQVNQFDASLGGPIRTDRIWFFGTFRIAKLVNGISRDPKQVQTLKILKPGFELFNNTSSSYQPYVKVTSKLTDKHDVSVLFQHDRANNSSDRELDADKISYSGYGGSLVSGRLTSVWTNRRSRAAEGRVDDERAGESDRALARRGACALRERRRSLGARLAAKLRRPVGAISRRRTRDEADPGAGCSVVPVLVA